jgi:hypothetical protein
METSGLVAGTVGKSNREIAIGDAGRNTNAM